jgi:voltage-gated potassium channel
MNPTPEDLHAVPLFASLANDELRVLTPWFEVQQADVGRRLTGEGAHGYSFFVLREGTASVTVDGTEIATLDTGDVFGEAAILGNGRRTATVTTTSPARLFVLYGTEFRLMQQQFPNTAAQIEVLMRQRVGDSA